MTACPSCGNENPETNKFCGECAAPLGTPARPVAEERKVVTSLFCDLVGFTATSESADPEDVGKMLAAYFAMARAQIEAHGGVVEKFIGDAVVGVFGVPAAHEDDPERAVRAGLRIAEDAEQLETATGEPLRLRVGINTGEALVRLGVSAASGDGFLTGDAINTASRIQSVAPEMGVAVGLATYEATATIFDYVELEPARLKGKSEPVRVFHAKTSRSRFGTDLTRTHDTPFIGREIDLAILKGIFDKTVAATSPQLVTVVGEPGLGKSRIVAELLGYIDSKPELITWRQGRCLPYGEGITFWALGEILKAHAGILESDTPAVATTKLEAVLPEGEERAWFRQRLLPLLGIEATSSAEREELFTAWRRFLEHIAEQDPTVLVFEDLHWADDAMLAFLEHLADRAEEVPLLVVGTARPELFEHHPEYAAGLLNVTPIRLSPLTEQETSRLVSALLETTVIPVELQRPILDRAGGNPLYAEEFVRLLKDKDLLVKKGTSWELKYGEEVPFPDSVHALIAARLDTLPQDRKSMLADAAVVGKVFWAGRSLRWVSASSPTSPMPFGSSREKSSCVPHGDPRSKARPNTRSGTSWPETSPTPSSPELPARRVTSLRRPGSSRELPSGSRTSPTCSPTTTQRPWSSRVRQGRPSRRASSKRRRSSSCPSQENVRSASTPPRRSRTSSERSPSPPKDIPNAPRRSLGSVSQH